MSPCSLPGNWPAFLSDGDAGVRLLLDTANEGVWLVDADCVTRYVNQRLCDMLGYAADEIVGHLLFDFFDDEWQEIARCRLQQRRTGARLQADTCLRHKNGPSVWALVTSSALFSPEGEYIGALAMLTDITERRAAEEDLARHEREFRAVVENALDIISRFDHDLRYLYINPAIQRATGHPPEYYLGRRAFETTRSPGMAAFWTRHLTEVLNTGREVTASFDYAGADGQHYFQARIVPEFDSAGAVTSCLSIVRDITEQRRAEERQRFLAEAGSLLSESLDYELTVQRVTRMAVPRLADFCVVDLVTESGEYRRVAVAHQDPQREELLAELRRRYPFDPQAAYGVPAVVRTRRSEMEPVTQDEWLVAAAQDEEHLRLMREVGMVSSMVVPLVARDRTLGAMSFMSAESGQVYTEADLALAEDLARRCAVAIDNARLYEEVQAMNRGKDEFMAMLSHELRNPLGAISGALRALSSDYGVPCQFADVQPELERQVSHMTRLVNELLDLGRITHRRITLRTEALDLRDAVAHAVQPLRGVASVRAQRITVSLPDDPVTVNADPIRIHQVITNLVQNAVKYTQRGGEIRVSVGREQSEALLRVADNGVGISAALLPRVFETFAQGDRTLDRSEGGLGIGLSLVKSLTELHGGTVTASSPGPGGGATFIVRLPLYCGSAAREIREPVPALHASRPRRVLVVEDDAFAARMLARVLESVGHRVCIALTGTEALSAGRRERPDVVLMDIGLPGLDGYEVARRLRADPALLGTTLVALTGYGREEDRIHALQAGFDHHLVKPVDFDALLALLD